MYVYSSRRPIQGSLSSGTTNHWSGRCGEQLCPWSLYGRQGDHWQRVGSNAETCRQLLRIAGIPCFPLVRRRHWLWFYLTIDGTIKVSLWFWPDAHMLITLFQCWLWQKGKARVRRVSRSPSLYGRCRAIQLDFDDSYNTWTLWLRIYGG